MSQRIEAIKTEIRASEHWYASPEFERKVDESIVAHWDVPWVEVDEDNANVETVLNGVEIQELFHVIEQQKQSGFYKLKPEMLSGDLTILYYLLYPLTGTGPLVDISKLFKSEYEILENVTNDLISVYPNISTQHQKRTVEFMRLVAGFGARLGNTHNTVTREPLSYPSSIIPYMIHVDTLINFQQGNEGFLLKELERLAKIAITPPFHKEPYWRRGEYDWEAAKNKKCWFVTAFYGESYHPCVCEIRDFRNKLMHNPIIGKSVTSANIYYLSLETSLLGQHWKAKLSRQDKGFVYAITWLACLILLVLARCSSAWTQVTNLSHSKYRA